MRDFSYNQNKLTCVKIVGYNKKGKPKRASGGDLVIYVCTDIGCNFIAWWRKKKNSKVFFFF